MKLFSFLILISVLSYKNAFPQTGIKMVADVDCCMYAEIPNQLIIMIDGVVLDSNNYSVRLSSGFYEKTDSCIWIKILSSHTTVTIIDTSGEIIAQKTFARTQIPNLEITADGRYSGGSFYKQDLLSLDGFTLIIRKFKKIPNYTISSFYAYLTIGNETRTFYCSGNLITDSLKNFMRKMRPYDKVNFTDFSISNGRVLDVSLIFNVIDYESNPFLDYIKLTKELDSLENEKYPNKQANTHALFSLEYIYNSLPVITESNCDYETLNCSTKVFQRISGQKKIKSEFVFDNDNSAVVRLFYNDTCVAKLSYLNNIISGSFFINDTLGNLRMEGKHQVQPFATIDTFMRVNPQNMQEELHYLNLSYSLKEGTWSYYFNKKLFATRKYKTGLLTKSTN